MKNTSPVTLSTSQNARRLAGTTLALTLLILSAPHALGQESEHGPSPSVRVVAVAEEPRWAPLAALDSPVSTLGIGTRIFCKFFRSC